MNPEEALLAAGWIREVMRGHEAHRAFDILSNVILIGLGYDGFVSEFERGVAGWHDDHSPYPRFV